MRVLFDSRPAGACRTGIGRYASTLAGLLRQGVSGHDCWSLGEDVTLDASNALEEELELPALLEREEVDLLHTPLFRLPALLPCRALITIHDAIPAVRPDLASKGFSELFAGAEDAARRADGVVCPSEHSSRDLARVLDLDPAKIHVVPEAPAPCFKPIPQTRARTVLSGLDLEEPFLVVVGSVEPRKNPLAVLDALAILTPQERPRVVFAGPAGGFALEAAVAERRLQDWIRILGEVDDEELVALYNLAHALVFPSLYEGFGLPPLEAFATHTPVIASNAACIPEIVGDAALLFDPSDAAALADRIRELLTTPSLAAELVERGRERLGRFTPERVRARLAGVYDMLQGGAA